MAKRSIDMLKKTYPSSLQEINSSLVFGFQQALFNMATWPCAEHKIQHDRNETKRKREMLEQMKQDMQTIFYFY